jgi:hypothetical protein
MIISINTEKTLDEIEHSFMIKALKRLGIDYTLRAIYMTNL